MEKYTDINTKEAYDIEILEILLNRNSANTMMVVLFVKT